MKLSNKTVKVATRLTTIVAVLIFIGSTGVWWWSDWSDPQNVFESALTNQLRTKGVAKSIIQQGASQSLDQAIAFSSTGDPVVRADTVIVQNDTVEAFVRSETVGTPTSEYVRFTTIETDQKNQSGEILDFSSIVGKWGDKSDQSQDSPGPEVYEEFVFGTVPTEYLSYNQANNLVQSMLSSGAYTPDYENSVSRLVNNRPVITYTVELNAARYVDSLKQLSALIGSETYASTDTAALEGRPAIPFQVTVDVLTHRILTVSTQSGSVERYGSFGVHVPAELPSETVPFSEIIDGINKAQQS